MADESILECFVGLGFKSPNQSTQLLLESIQQASALMGFPAAEQVEQLLASVTEPLVRLITARAIDRIEVRSEAVIVRFELQYNASPEDPEELDLSMLELVPLETESLALWFFAHDPQFATYIGFSEIEKQSTKRLQIGLSGLEMEKAQLGGTFPEQATDGLIGKNRNGNRPTCDDFHA